MKFPYCVTRDEVTHVVTQCVRMFPLLRIGQAVESIYDIPTSWGLYELNDTEKTVSKICSIIHSREYRQ